jgi:hypothetical protein
MNSSIFTLDWKDLGKAFINSVIAAFLTALYAIVQNGSFPTVGQLKVAGLAALVTGTSIILKRLLTNDNDEFLKANRN